MRTRKINLALLRSSLLGAEEGGSAVPAVNATFLVADSLGSSEDGCPSIDFEGSAGCSEGCSDDLAALASLIVVLQVFFRD